MAAIHIELKGETDREIATPGTPLEVEVRVFDGEGRRAFGVHRFDAPASAADGGRRLFGVAFALEPRRYSIRVAVHDPVAQRSGSVYGTVTVPEFRGRRLEVSSLMLSVSESEPATDLTAWPDGLPRATLRRTFAAAEAVAAVVQVYDGRAPARDLPVRSEILDDRDRVVFEERRLIARRDFTADNVATLQVPLPLDRLQSGMYLLRVTFGAGTKDELVRQIVFTRQ